MPCNAPFNRCNCENTFTEEERKKIYNQIKEKDMFNTPGTFTRDYFLQILKAGAQEAVPRRPRARRKPCHASARPTAVSTNGS